MCKLCDAQLYNITRDGNNTRTTELTDDVRARLSGAEYLLSVVAPRLGTEELTSLVAALCESAALMLDGSTLAAAMRERPWARASAYDASGTRAAIRTVHAALVVAHAGLLLVGGRVVLTLGRRSCLSAPCGRG